MRASRVAEAAGAAQPRQAPTRAATICAAVVVLSGAVALVSLRPSTSCEMTDRYLRTMAEQWPSALAEAGATDPAMLSCGDTLAAVTAPRDAAFDAGSGAAAQRRN